MIVMKEDEMIFDIMTLKVVISSVNSIALLCSDV